MTLLQLVQFMSNFRHSVQQEFNINLLQRLDGQLKGWSNLKDKTMHV